MLPVALPSSYLKRMHSMILKFIWKGKTPRIKYDQLINTKNKGGWGAPDISKYYEAIALGRVIDWFKNKDKQWVEIENSTSKIKLHKIIWYAPKLRKQDTKMHEITRHALGVWDRVHKREHWQYNSPLMSLKEVDYFPPGKEEWFGKWLLDENLQLRDVMDRGKICSMQELKKRGDRMIISPWRYAQLKHFIASLPQPIRTMNSLLPLEKICVERNKKSGFSRIYKILVELKRIDILPCISKWEKELGLIFAETEVDLLVKRLLTTSVNYKVLELNYKCLTRMYMTPDKMHRIDKDRSRLCWRGCGEIGTMAHVWWSCPEIAAFWDEIRKYIKEITKHDLPRDPRVLLFHLSEMHTKAYLRSLLPHLIDAAKSLIPISWNRKERPTMREWFNKINETQDMEYLRFSEGTKMEAFRSKWGDWEKFRISLKAAEIWLS